VKRWLGRAVLYVVVIAAALWTLSSAALTVDSFRRAGSPDETVRVIAVERAGSYGKCTKPHRYTVEPVDGSGPRESFERCATGGGYAVGQEIGVWRDADDGLITTGPDTMRWVGLIMAAMSAVIAYAGIRVLRATRRRSPVESTPVD
jgi:hypothetical protein